MQFIASIGAGLINLVAYFFNLIWLFGESISTIWIYFRKNRKRTRDEIVFQILFTGVQGIPLIFFMGFMIGSIVIIQSTTLAPKLGAGAFLGKIMVIGVLRELAPFVTAFVVIGRSGAALTTYLGNMKVSNEIDALEMMGIDPRHFKVMPSIIGGMISVASLTIIFSFASIVGGYMFYAYYTGLSFSIYIDQILIQLSGKDLILFFIKSISFGAIISTISCYHALKVNYSFQEVPQATIKAVVNSILITMLVNVVVTGVFYADLL